MKQPIATASKDVMGRTPVFAGVKNGNLMRRAEAEFDVFVTVDRNLSYQQNL
jgi:hypothetical protein